MCMNQRLFLSAENGSENSSSPALARDPATGRIKSEAVSHTDKPTPNSDVAFQSSIITPKGGVRHGQEDIGGILSSGSRCPHIFGSTRQGFTYPWSSVRLSRVFEIVFRVSSR
ncbi:hypothetical protein CRV24_006125 [Beauveria bassiana]|nr:hypothetical protein CRV24_006125 [Beauveria bassiana]KAH8708889.1 hypothetical protein HC256_008822 [Beauveria bassiana]